MRIECTALVKHADDRFRQKHQSEVDGSTRNATSRMPFARVGRKSVPMPPIAARDRAGRVTVATATPKTPMGSCIRRKA
jgi:hypothetical protein